jgi:hypothetical protein
MRKLVGLMALMLSLVAPVAPLQSQTLQSQTLGSQTLGSVAGTVQDQTGAVIPNAEVVLSIGSHVRTEHSKGDGRFQIGGVAAGNYELKVAAPGFAPFTMQNVSLQQGKKLDLHISLKLATTEEQVTVTPDTQQVSLNSDENASARVIKGKDLDALDENPDALLSELTALAGPAAGANGGELYVDGFSGGQLPQKSSIREVRINQNPLSAEFDRLGYGRIEIFTNPGTEKIAAHLSSSYLNSALDTANPLVVQQPSYQFYWVRGDISGPIKKEWSYFLNVFDFQRQNQGIISAINPADTTGTLSEAFPTPSSLLTIRARTDFQAGKSQTISISDFLYRTVQTGSGVGSLNLPEQAESTHDWENTLQFKDIFTVNPHFINETNARWWRVRQNATPASTRPSLTVQGAFTTGGSNAGTSDDHQDLVELQNYSTAALGSHALRFGTRLRSYREASYTTAGSNGAYLFQSTSDYLAGIPYQYTGTLISNPSVRTLLFDGAIFLQDEWRMKPTINVSLGLRLEGQSHIHDPMDAAPRVAVAWSPNHKAKSTPATVYRAGYGWFYDRFTVPNQIGGNASPYLTQVIRNNGINQQNYIVKNPSFYDPNTPASGELLTQTGTSSTPYLYSLDRHFHAALDMQATAGIDQQVGKHSTLSVTYLYTRGVHQYLTNNVTAAAFDPATYTVTGAAPAVYNYQFQSGGIYKQNQLIFSSATHIGKLSMSAVYTFNHANSDTQGVNYFPSVANDPKQDYGRAVFGIRHQLSLQGTYTTRWGIELAPFLAIQSGTPYNITVGNDLTENNQSNARPTFGTCGAMGVISTSFGCLDTNPTGKGEKIIPFNLGTGPANAVLNLATEKTVSFHSRGTKASAEDRKITFVLGATNLLNIVNFGTPNGVLSSPLFARSQSLAAGAFNSPSPGNRTVYVTAIFSF